MISQAVLIVRKDLLLERRSKSSLNALVFLAGMILLIVSFALGPDIHRLRSASSAILWIAFIFAGILAFSRAYEAESHNGCFEGLFLFGASPRAVYVGKLLATILVMLLVELTVVIAMGLLYDLAIWRETIGLVTVAVLGTAGVASIGVLYGRLAMLLRAREVMLPLLVFPIVIPALLASVKATAIVLHGSTGGLGMWIELLIVFDVVFVTGGLLTFETLSRE